MQRTADKRIKKLKATLIRYPILSLHGDKHIQKTFAIIFLRRSGTLFPLIRTKKLVRTLSATNTSEKGPDKQCNNITFLPLMYY